MSEKSPHEMSMDELLEREKARPPLTEEEIEDQITSIALSELKLAGDITATEEDVRETIRLTKITSND